jgi:hypothetical protein
MTLYNNIPQENAPSTFSSDPTVKVFNTFYQVPIELDGVKLTAIKSYFESRGYEPASAESVALIILSQATKDGLNPFDILETLRGFTEVQISAIVGEILNYNRFKTSSLGITVIPTPADEIQRNILL